MNIELGPEMFRFTSFVDWVSHAQSRFRRAGVGASQYVCIDVQRGMRVQGCSKAQCDRVAGQTELMRESLLIPCAVMLRRRLRDSHSDLGRDLGA